MILYDDYAINVKLCYGQVAIVKININDVYRLRKLVLSDEIISVSSISSKVVSAKIIKHKHKQPHAMITISKDNVVVTTFYNSIEEKITIII